MHSSQIERKLAAIMFTDIAGYTEQMSQDEAMAINLLNKKESVLKPLIKKHNGTYVKGTGDGSLSYFNSAVDAAMCAKKFQESIYDDKDLNVKIGVHLGDTIFENGDIRGDGVNIASRLENISTKGSILISKEVYDQLSNQKEFDAVSLGLQSLKGVGRLIEVYGLQGDFLISPDPTNYQDSKVKKHSDNEVPSIAIIPFNNKGKKEDDFFSYGISADLISECNNAELIRVASLKDIEKLDYHNLTNTELSDQLSVRYIVQGTLWRLKDVFQLTVEIYDTKDQLLVWSDRWQEKWENLPMIQVNLLDGVLKTLNKTTSINQNFYSIKSEAYEYYLKGKYNIKYRKDIKDFHIAKDLLYKSIDINKNLISAKTEIAFIYRELGDYKNALEVYHETLNQSIKIDNQKVKGDCQNGIGNIYYYQGEYDQAIKYYKDAFVTRKISGSKAGMSATSDNIANVYYYQGLIDQSLKFRNYAYKIREEIDNKRGMGASLNNIGNIYLFEGDYIKALNYYNRAYNIIKQTKDNRILGYILSSLGLLYMRIGDYNKSMEYYNESIIVRKNLGDKFGLGGTFNSIGKLNYYFGKYEKAWNYYNKSFDIHKEINDKRGMIYPINGKGIIYTIKGDNINALKHFKKSYKIQKDLKLKDYELTLNTFTLICLIEKNQNIIFKKNKLLSYIKEVTNIEFELNLRLYELLEDTSYLETAYNQIQEKASILKEDLATKFLNYPIPKAIVEEWEKVKF